MTRRFVTFGRVFGFGCACTVGACGGHTATAGVSCGPGTMLTNGVCLVVAASGSTASDSGFADASGVPEVDASQEAISTMSPSDASDASLEALSDASSAGLRTCPVGRGPDMVALPNGTGGRYCIDTTEVTQAQYKQFLDAKGNDASGQIGICSGNTTFAPSVSCCSGRLNCFDPTTLANYPVTCVNWCDAYGFCAWAGKHLCGTFSDMSSQFISEAWLYACQGGPAGHGFKGPCNDRANGLSPVKSFPDCRGIDSPWSDVYDLVGNARELNDACGPFNGGTACVVVDGVPFCQTLEGRAPVDQVDWTMGFRCCAAL
jgi:Sulfatase-modifying factor enzyme 1